MTKLHSIDRPDVNSHISSQPRGSNIPLSIMFYFVSVQRFSHYLGAVAKRFAEACETKNVSFILNPLPPPWNERKSQNRLQRSTVGNLLQKRGHVLPALFNVVGHLFFFFFYLRDNTTLQDVSTLQQARLPTLSWRRREHCLGLLWQLLLGKVLLHYRPHWCLVHS